MAEPYGLLYGLGAGLSQVPKAYLEGQRFATQQQAAEMQKEAMQRKLAEDAAYTQAASGGPIPTDYMGQSAWFGTLAQAPGLAPEMRIKATEQANKLKEFGKTDMLQRAGRAVLGGDYKSANALIRQAELPFQEIRPSSDPDYAELVPSDPNSPVRRARVSTIAAYVGTPIDKATNFDFRFEGLESKEKLAEMADETRRYIAEMGDDTRRYIAEGNWNAAFQLQAAKAGMSGQKATAFVVNSAAYAKQLEARGVPKDQAYAQAMERFAPGGGTVFSREQGKEERDRQFMLDLAKVFAGMGQLKQAKEIAGGTLPVPGAPSPQPQVGPRPQMPPAQTAPEPKAGSRRNVIDKASGKVLRTEVYDGYSKKWIPASK